MLDAVSADRCEISHGKSIINYCRDCNALADGVFSCRFTRANVTGVTLNEYQVKCIQRIVYGAAPHRCL